MPINIFELTDDRKTVTIPVGSSGGQMTLTYRPNSLTPARELAIMRRAELELDDEGDDDQDAARVQRNIERQISTFLELVESWDFEGPLARDVHGDAVKFPIEARHDPAGYCAEHGHELLVPAGQVIPLTYDNLVVIPSHFLLGIVEAVNKDMRPDPKRKRR